MLKCHLCTFFFLHPFYQLIMFSWQLGYNFVREDVTCILETQFQLSLQDVTNLRPEMCLGESQKLSQTFSAYVESLAKVCPFCNEKFYVQHYTR